jgi:hypothetical protein
MREFKKIHFNALAAFISSANMALSSNAYIALASLANEGSFPPVELFERLVSGIASDSRASLAVVAACKEEQLSTKLIDVYLLDPPDVSEDVLKVLMCTARHPALRPMLRTLVEQLDLKNRLKDYENAVNVLMKIVGLT